MTLDPRPSDAELLRRHQEQADRKRQRGSGITDVMRGTPVAVSLEHPTWWDPRMNFTEEAYAQELELGHCLTCKVRAWKYEPFSMRLAPNTYYRPDFLVQPSWSESDRLEIHEVKGYWRDDARAKFKIAAALYPMFVFRAVRRVEGVFQVIETLND